MAPLVPIGPPGELEVATVAGLEDLCGAPPSSAEPLAFSGVWTEEVAEGQWELTHEPDEGD